MNNGVREKKRSRNPCSRSGSAEKSWVGTTQEGRGAATTIASNKVFGGSKTKMADMSAASGRRMAVAGAIIGEKFTYLGANMTLGFYTISHPMHPLQRVAAKERNVNVKAAAAGTETLTSSLSSHCISFRACKRFPMSLSC